MKQILMFFFLQLCVITQAQDFPKIGKEMQQIASIEVKSDLKAITKIHLEMIFKDLIETKKFSKKQIAILDNYEVLKDFRFSTNGYSFEAIDKSAINLTFVNRLLFWRMDVTQNKALYEFYLSNSDNDTQKLSYAFVLEKETWKLIRN